MNFGRIFNQIDIKINCSNEIFFKYNIIKGETITLCVYKLNEDI